MHEEHLFEELPKSNQENILLNVQVYRKLSIIIVDTHSQKLI